MKDFFRKALAVWKRFAAIWAIVMTTIILFIIYLFVFGLMSILAFILRQDLLDKRLTPVKSYWKKKELIMQMENPYKHQF